MTRGEPARRERPASKVHRYAWLCDARAALAADARPLRSVQTPDHLDDFDDFCAVLMAGQVINGISSPRSTSGRTGTGWCYAAITWASSRWNASVIDLMSNACSTFARLARPIWRRKGRSLQSRVSAATSVL